MPHAPTVSPNASARRPIHLANVALAAIGLIGIGVMIGGWSNQPARNTRSSVTGIAVDPNDNFLYRTFDDGRGERLVLGRGVTNTGTTAEWKIFKEN